MRYNKNNLNTLASGNCRTFCNNVCSLFSSGRQQCIKDCLACSHHAKSSSRPLVSKKVQAGSRKHTSCSCGK